MLYKTYIYYRINDTFSLQDIKSWIPIPQHHTHVTNNLGKKITVVVIHPDGQREVLRIQSGCSRMSPTARGKVMVTLLNDAEDDIVESRTVNSDISVTATKDSKGDPILVRTLYGKIWVKDPQDDYYLKTALIKH